MPSFSSQQVKVMLPSLHGLISPAQNSLILRIPSPELFQREDTLHTNSGIIKIWIRRKK